MIRMKGQTARVEVDHPRIGPISQSRQPESESWRKGRPSLRSCPRTTEQSITLLRFSSRHLVICHAYRHEMTSTPRSPTALDVSELYRALGSKADAEPIQEVLRSISSDSEIRPEAQVSAFSDGSFHNYYQHGVSLFYTPDGRLDRADLYNPSSGPQSEASGSRRRRKPPTYLPAPDLVFNFPSTTVPIPAPPPRDPNLPVPKESKTKEAVPTSIERPGRLVVDGFTKAKTLVECFGEPSKKVEGKAGWLETYMEWEVDVLDLQGGTVRVGVLVELREGGGEGMSVWDRAPGWQWACLKVFKLS